MNRPDTGLEQRTLDVVGSAHCQAAAGTGEGCREEECLVVRNCVDRPLVTLRLEHDLERVPSGRIGLWPGLQARTV